MTILDQIPVPEGTATLKDSTDGLCGHLVIEVTERLGNRWSISSSAMSVSVIKVLFSMLKHGKIKTEDLTAFQKAA